MFENETIRGIYISRYVASWVIAGGSLKAMERQWFKWWLKSLVINGEHLTNDEIRRIYNYADNGKLELQENAKLFRDKLKYKEASDFGEIWG